jgi:hypothetical protein
MLLKPQDLLVLLKLVVSHGRAFSYAELAAELGMSASEVHAAVRRCREAGLLAPEELRPLKQPLLEFLEHGLRYVLPLQRGPIARGMPTAHAAPPLNTQIVGAMAQVWPDAHGRVEGESCEPIYRSAVVAAKNDRKLYHCLALVDALRGGRARERKLAGEYLREMIGAA